MKNNERFAAVLLIKRAYDLPGYKQAWLGEFLGNTAAGIANAPNAFNRWSLQTGADFTNAWNKTMHPTWTGRYDANEDGTGLKITNNPTPVAKQTETASEEAMGSTTPAVPATPAVTPAPAASAVTPAPAASAVTPAPAAAPATPQYSHTEAEFQGGPGRQWTGWDHGRRVYEDLPPAAQTPQPPATQAYQPPATGNIDARLWGGRNVAAPASIAQAVQPRRYLSSLDDPNNSYSGQAYVQRARNLTAAQAQVEAQRQRDTAQWAQVDPRSIYGRTRTLNQLTGRG